MNPIKKLNEEIDWFLSGIMKHEKSSNVELLVLFGLTCFCWGVLFVCIIDTVKRFHEDPLQTVLGFISWALMGYLFFRMLFGKNQLVSEILKRMDKE